MPPAQQELAQDRHLRFGQPQVPGLDEVDPRMLPRVSGSSSVSTIGSANLDGRHRLDPPREVLLGSRRVDGPRLAPVFHAVSPGLRVGRVLDPDKRPLQPGKPRVAHELGFGGRRQRAVYASTAAIAATRPARTTRRVIAPTVHDCQQQVLGARVGRREFQRAQASALRARSSRRRASSASARSRVRRHGVARASRQRHAEPPGGRLRVALRERRRPSAECAAASNGSSSATRACAPQPPGGVRGPVEQCASWRAASTLSPSRARSRSSAAAARAAVARFQREVGERRKRALVARASPARARRPPRSARIAPSRRRHPEAPGERQLHADSCPGGPPPARASACSGRLRRQVGVLGRPSAAREGGEPASREGRERLLQRGERHTERLGNRGVAGSRPHRTRAAARLHRRSPRSRRCAPRRSDAW